MSIRLSEQEKYHQNLYAHLDFTDAPWPPHTPEELLTYLFEVKAVCELVMQTDENEDTTPEVLTDLYPKLDEHDYGFLLDLATEFAEFVVLLDAITIHYESTERSTTAQQTQSETQPIAD